MESKHKDPQEWPAKKATVLESHHPSQGQLGQTVRKSNEKDFSKAQKGNKKALESLLDQERPLLFDYTLRMTGDLSRSIDIMQEYLATLEPKHLQFFKSDFIFRQALLQGLRNKCKSIWHGDTSRLENAYYLHQAHGVSENLKDIRLSLDNKAKEFEREFRQLPGIEREALWIKARLGASIDEVAQVMEVKASEVEMHLIHALFRLENKSFGQDPENLVAHLPLHPLPAPVSNVTMDLSMVMQGIKSGQKAPSRRLWMAWMFAILLLLGLGGYAAFEFNLLARLGLPMIFGPDANLHGQGEHRLLEQEKAPSTTGALEKGN